MDRNGTEGEARVSDQVSGIGSVRPGGAGRADEHPLTITPPWPAGLDLVEQSIQGVRAFSDFRANRRNR